MINYTRISNWQLVIAYSSCTDPVPGGCNIEFALENSPFIFVHRQPPPAFSTSGPLIDYIEFQPAALGNERSPGRQCGQLSGARLNYELYAYYGGSDGDAQDEYFHSIDSMSNRNWLAKHATLVNMLEFAKPR